MLTILKSLFEFSTVSVKVYFLFNSNTSLVVSPSLLRHAVLCISTGIAYGQVNLSCEAFCLSKKTVCTCSLAQTSLLWKLVNGSVELGQRTVVGSSLNQTNGLFSMDPSISGSFEVTVIEFTSEMITSTMSFITLSEYQGYGVRCEASFMNFFTIPIVIPGM